MNWLTLLPQRVGKLRETLAPLLDAYASLQRFVDQIMSIMSQRAPHAPAQVTVPTPNSLVDLIAVSAPGAIIQMLFAIGRAHVLIPVTNAQLVCRIRLDI